MKKYLVFVCPYYYPVGGSGDLYLVTEDLTDATEKLFEEHKYSEYHEIEIWNTENMTFKKVDLESLPHKETDNPNADMEYIKEDFLEAFKEIGWKKIKTTEERFG